MVNTQPALPFFLFLPGINSISGPERYTGACLKQQSYFYLTH